MHNVLPSEPGKKKAILSHVRMPTHLLSISHLRFLYRSFMAVRNGRLCKIRTASVGSRFSSKVLRLPAFAFSTGRTLFARLVRDFVE
jgi:uncharacterized membrane protein